MINKENTKLMVLGKKQENIRIELEGMNITRTDICNIDQKETGENEVKARIGTSIKL